MYSIKGPLTVGWDITHMCNLRCKHCYANAGKRIEEEFALEEIKKIVDELDSLGTVLIALAGGEPMLRKDIYEIISYIKSKGMEVFLNTNGTMINEDTIIELINAGLTHIEISVDGLEEDHDFIRGKGSFEKVLNALEICKKYNIKVGIMSTLFKHNYKNIPNFIDYFYDKGVVGIGFLRFIPSGRGKENNNILAMETMARKEAIEMVYKKRIQYGEDFYLKIETPVSYLVAKEYDELMNKHKYTSFMQRGCDGGILSCQILSSGLVTFCPQMGIGNYNLHEYSMEFIWQNDEYFKQLRTRELKGKCGRCKEKDLCGGCRVDAFINKGDVLEEDSGCWIEC